MSCIAVAAIVDLLAWDMYQTRAHKVRIWKSSALPSLLYGTSWADDPAKPNYLGEMMQNAKSVSCCVPGPEVASKHSMIHIKNLVELTV